MDDRSEDSEEVFTEGAFEPLSSDVRREIIRSAERTFSGVDTISFSDLLEIGPLDDPGHLRYHVGELEGTLLVNVDGEYRPMFGTIREAIGYNAANPGRDPPFRKRVLTSYQCPHCPELLDLGYSNAERLFFHCPRHELVFDQDLAPSVSSDTPTDWIDFGSRSMHFDLERLDSGFCPRCNGRVNGLLSRAGLTYSSRIESKSEEFTLWADFRCEKCEYEFRYPAARRAMTDDRVRRFFTDHGIDIRIRPFPDRYLDTFGVYEEDDDGNPIHACLRYAIEESRLTVELDENASIVSVETSTDAATGSQASLTCPDQTVYSFETVIREVVANDEHLIATTARGDSYGVCPRTGELRWSLPSTGSFTRPLIHGEIVYLVGLDQIWEDGIEKDQERNQLFAVEGHSGDVVWRRRVDGRPSWRTMTIFDDTLLVPALVFGLHALDRETGETVWSEPFDPEGVFSLATDGGSIAYVGGSDAMQGVDLTDRERTWTYRTDGPVIDAQVLDDGLFISTRSGLTALDPENGSKRWSRETSRGPRGFTVSRSSLIVNTIDSVDCLRSTGEETWSWSDGTRSYAIPSADAEQVYVGTDEGSVQALHLETGREVWAARTTQEHPIRSSIAVNSESVFVGNCAGRIYAIDKPTGEINWQMMPESA